jgi:lactate dehydrogenase-like 2-hydroxyacid dehydrogenase
MIVTPGGDETRQLVDKDVLNALGPTGVLVNVARGSVVDESALVEALQSGTILSAGLDVFENEPTVHPGLLEVENVVLLPHVGSASVPTRDAMGRLVVDNLVEWFDTGEPVTPVQESADLVR